MKNKLLSLEDDNAIMITAEFWECGCMLKNASEEPRCYLLNLIVCDDITLDQLLWALQRGLQQKLIADYDLNPRKISLDTIYEEQWKLAQEEIWSNRARRLRNDMDSRDYQKIHSKLGSVRDLDHEIEEMESSAQYQSVCPKPKAMTASEQNCQDWMLCWAIFQECLQAYLTRQLISVKSGTRALIGRNSVTLLYNEDNRTQGAASHSTLWLDHALDGRKPLHTLGFVHSTHLIFDPMNWHSDSELRSRERIDSPVAYHPPHLACHRQIPVPKFRQIEILPPSAAPKPPHQSLIPSVISPLATTGALLGAMSLMEFPLQPNQAGILIGAMAASTAAVSLTGHCIHNLGYYHQLHRWYQNYEFYINSTLEDLSGQRQQILSAMLAEYPPAYEPASGDDLVSRILRAHSSLFCRRPDEPDFLSVRLGLSTAGSHLVPSGIEITGGIRQIVPYRSAYQGDQYFCIDCGPHTWKKLLRKTKRSFLSNLPSDLSEQYSSLSGAPVMLHLANTPAFGAVLADSSVSITPLLYKLILDLCAHHRPEDLQISIFFPHMERMKDQQETIQLLAHLPHFNRLFSTRSSFAFNAEDAQDIMDRLLNLKNNEQPCPHVLLLLLEEYGFRDHGLAQYLPNSRTDSTFNSAGITFMFCSRYESCIPEYCSPILKINADQDWEMVPGASYSELDTTVQDPRKQFALHPDADLPLPDLHSFHSNDRNRFYRAFLVLGALSQNYAKHSILPPHLDLFEVLADFCGQNHSCFSLAIPGTDPQQQKNLCMALHRFVTSNWKRASSSDTRYQSLAAPIGQTEEAILVPDLAAEGPNLLITSGPQMGKTECLKTYLLSLCACHSTRKVEIWGIDIKSGSLMDQLRILPHVKQCMTGGAPQYINQLFSSLLKELKLRRQKFKMMGVRTLEEYQWAMLHFRKYSRVHLHLREDRDAAKIAELRKLGRIPHLFLVIDNFSELFSAYSTIDPSHNFQLILQKIMSIGKDLGLHIILASDDQYIDPKFAKNFSCRIHLQSRISEFPQTSFSGQTQLQSDGRASYFSPRYLNGIPFQAACSSDKIIQNRISAVKMTYAKSSGFYESFCDAEQAATDAVKMVDYFAADFLSEVPPIQKVIRPYEVHFHAPEEPAAKLGIKSTHSSKKPQRQTASPESKPVIISHVPSESPYGENSMSELVKSDVSSFFQTDLPTNMPADCASSFTIESFLDCQSPYISEEELRTRTQMDLLANIISKSSEFLHR